VIFLHIPKAAGATLNVVLRRHFAENETYRIDGRNVAESIATFKRLPRAERERIRLLAGHQGFGLHAYLGAPSTYVTLLRDPVDRAVSHYYYARSAPGHYLHDEIASRGIDLEDYPKLAEEVRNGQTRMLAGSDGATSDACGRGELELAKRRLAESFCLFGVTEQFDRFLVLLKRRLGLRRLCYHRMNVTPRRPRRADVPQSAAGAIERSNEFDMELYRFALAGFEEACAAAPGLDREVRSLRRRNRFHRAARKVLAPVRRVFGATRREGT
jgi:hypothetical protein